MKTHWTSALAQMLNCIGMCSLNPPPPKLKNRKGLPRHIPMGFEIGRDLLSAKGCTLAHSSCQLHQNVEHLPGGFFCSILFDQFDTDVFLADVMMTLLRFHLQCAREEQKCATMMVHLCDRSDTHLCFFHLETTCKCQHTARQTACNLFGSNQMKIGETRAKKHGTVSIFQQFASYTKLCHATTSLPLNLFS